METNKFKKIINNNYIKYGLILIAGLFIGWLIFGGSSIIKMNQLSMFTKRVRNKFGLVPCTLR